MATYLNAYKGVRRIYYAEIVNIISAFLIVITAILGLVSQTDTVLFVSGIIALIAIILLIFAFVMQMLGLEQAGKDQEAFKIAFWVVVTGIVLGIVASILQAMDNEAIELLGDVASALTSLISILVVMFIITGISALVSDPYFASKGKSICITMAIVYAITFTLNILSSLCTNEDDTIRIVFGALGLVAAIVDLIVYINIFLYYKKALTLL